MAVLLADIARRAKVSPATVSRVINQPHLVAPERRELVRQVMDSVKYVPMPAHRRRGPKTRLNAPKKIAVWFVGAKKNPNLDWFHEHLLQSQQANERRNIEIGIVFSESANDLPRNIAEREVDGVILQGGEPSPECMAKIGDLPHVWFMTRRTADYPGDYVEPDNEMNGRMAAEYLQKRGHKNTAVIAADPGYSAVAWRARAFAEHARSLELTVATILGKPKPMSYLEVAPLHEESDSLVKRLMQTTPRPTGLYIPVDHFCGSLFRSMRVAGLKPERDFEVILGNYNPIIYHNLDHLPAAIDINLSTLVRKVVDHLVWRIENPSSPGRVGVSIAPSLVAPPSAPRA
ncbi:MAG TPA: LacI family DNA-binding transcriptional regulator [Opitutaceae bacterium]|nr:LacI family DNA-binding transcriptional regulator [Opitutaceae bacterium]